MPLESLLELVKTLSYRIDEHGPALRQSEALTRYALIDPLLRELGWDTSDPDMVVPEYRSGNGRADYALMNDGSPAMMVEAKSLATPLQDSVLAQGINYCLMEGTSYFSVTDGRLWEIYETHKPVPINDKQIVRFDLKDNPAQVCLKALALWRYSLETGHVIEAQSPVLPLSPDHSKPSPTIPDEKPNPQPTSVVPVIDDGMGWLPLSKFIPGKSSPPPDEIQFPDDSRVKINYSYQIPAETTRWLLNNNLVDMGRLPIERGKRYILSTSNVHQNGRDFDAPKQVGHIYIESKYDGKGPVANTQLIIQRMGQDPAKFKVRIS